MRYSTDRSGEPLAGRAGLPYRRAPAGGADREAFGGLFATGIDLEERATGSGAVDVDRAARLNRSYARSLGWEAHTDRIARVIGLRAAASPDQRALAEAVAHWQRRHGLAADGIIGPNTWARMRPLLGTPQPAAAQTPRGPFGSLTVTAPAARRFAYGFTGNDAVWTARLLVGEAGGRDDRDNAAVVWAMFNRYALFTHRHYSTFHQFLRVYSTPLQPVLRSWQAAKRHAHRTGFVRTGGFYASPPAPPGLPRGQLRRHLDLQDTPWSRLPASARSLADRALKGGVENPVGVATEFASTTVFFRTRYGRAPDDEEWRRFTEAHARRKGWRWIGSVPGLNQRKNAFFVQGRVANLPPDTVRVVPPA